MQFPDLNLEKEKLAAAFSREYELPPREIRIIASPYRISPLGAHIDHQGGPVLGMSINAYSLLAYAPDDNAQVTLLSKNYPGQVKFNLHQIPVNTDSFGVPTHRQLLWLSRKTGRLTAVLQELSAACFRDAG
jgi:galactokinase